MIIIREKEGKQLEKEIEENGKKRTRKKNEWRKQEKRKKEK